MTNKTQEMYTYVINLFQKELKEPANRLEKQRKFFNGFSKFFKAIAIIGGIIAGVILAIILITLGSAYLGYPIGLMYSKNTIAFGLYGGIILASSSWCLHSIIETAYCTKVKKNLYSKIYQSLDKSLVYYPGGIKLPIQFYSWERLFFQDPTSFEVDITQLNRILPYYNYIRTDDVIIGNYEGHSIKIIEFSLIEKRVTHDSKGRTQTDYYEVFHGVLFKTTMAKNIKVPIFINAKNKSSRIPSGFQKINLESNEFEKLFDIYSIDQIESRYFFNTKMMDDFIKLRKTTKDEISGFIAGNNVNLFIHSSKDMFEPDINKPVNDPNTYFDVIFQAKTILDIITKLNLDSKTGL